jgi:hypothetical protein
MRFEKILQCTADLGIINAKDEDFLGCHCCLPYSPPVEHLFREWSKKRFAAGVRCSKEHGEVSSNEVSSNEAYWLYLLNGDEIFTHVLRQSSGKG